MNKNYRKRLEMKEKENLKIQKLSALHDLEYLYEEVGNRQRKKEVRNETL